MLMRAESVRGALGLDGWNPERLAELTGFPRAECTAILNDKHHQLTSGKLLRLMAALDIDPSKLAAGWPTQATAVSPRPIVVGVSGASCSGKTWLAHTLDAQCLKGSVIIDLDGYYRDMIDIEGLEHGHDNPAAIDFDRVVEDIIRLKSGEPIDHPLYCYAQHRVTGTRQCLPQPMILVEGLFVLAHERLREQIDIKIWIESADDLKLTRRITRDMTDRERTVEEIRERYARDVIPGYRKFVEPLRKHADLHVHNDGLDANVAHPVVKLIVTYIQLAIGSDPIS
jgi:uridine kinase